MIAAFFHAFATTRLVDDAGIDRAQRRLDALSRTMDSAFAIPGTKLRFGADALLNLIPGLGFVLSKGIAAYLVWEARRLGAPTPVLARMLGNLGVDAVLSAIPVLGWVADGFYRANDRNMALLRTHLARDIAAWRGPVIDPSA